MNNDFMSAKNNNSNNHDDMDGAAQKQEKSTRKSKNAFRTISEVADELDVQQHVLRFWETKFSQVRPLKRGGGRRYYRPEDVTLLKRIHELLYTEGYTIKGVQKLFRENGKNTVLEGEAGTSAALKSAVLDTPQSSEPSQGLNTNQKKILVGMLEELKELKAIVQG